jgi:hypothetical protein
MGASLYSLPEKAGSYQLIFISGGITVIVSKGLGRHNYYRYKSLKWRLENDHKQRSSKKASLVVNRGEYP